MLRPVRGRQDTKDHSLDTNEVLMTDDLVVIAERALLLSLEGRCVPAHSSKRSGLAAIIAS